MVKSIEVEELSQKMKDNPNLVLVDCREKDERDYCSIEGTKHIPLSAFSELALKELNKNDEIYIHCHHGGRSRRACEFLEEQGYSNTVNVAGGIDAWSLRVDNRVQRY